MNNSLITIIFSFLFVLIGCTADDPNLEDKLLKELQSLTTVSLSDITIDEMNKHKSSNLKSCHEIIGHVGLKYQKNANTRGEKVYFGIQCFSDDLFVTISEAVAIPEPSPNVL